MASTIPSRIVGVLRIPHLSSSLAHLSTRNWSMTIANTQWQAERRQNFYSTTSSREAGPNTARPPRRGFFTGLLILSGTALSAFAAGIYFQMEALSASAADSARTFKPESPEAQAVEDYINNHELVKELRANSEMTESRPHLKIPPLWRAHSLTAGALMGPGLVSVPPFDWTETGGKSYVQVAHLGEDLCGHPGIIHGGFLATILDEGLARCCYPALPHRIGLTAHLSIDYRAPCMANSYVVLRATTIKVEGRKAWVEGRIETMVEPGETPQVLAEAKALFVSPRGAAAMTQLLPPR